ncbi:histidine kinase N-terminal 7TM domain-containing diguanylate cyclase [Saliniramus sp.]|uniref:histidine kinase N-terminal 7TM domain-containing diguanylate cyclase n=1 Tax=Saliniramus sp. TaxID=2986772 RepID=UPI002BF8BC70|nr:histidine kinase N-terminal 7TM domain-containing protein [Saliniramus sp.]HMB09955.1 histidine kinase N-terminal 7TM domain-containing protein [Saliniramus sp.]
MDYCSDAVWALSPQGALLGGICLGVLMLSLWVARQHDFPGRDAFVVAHLGMGWWLLAAMLEVAAPTGACKQVFAQAAWPGVMVVPTFWAAFLWQYANSSTERLSPGRLAVLMIIPVMAGIVAFTNEHHHLLYGAGTAPADDSPHAPMIYDHGPVFWSFAIYLYVFLAFGLWSIARALVTVCGSARRHYLGFLVFTLINISANLGYIFFGITVFGFDPTPFSFAVTLGVFTWLIAGKRLFDLLPVANRLLIERLPDPVIVVDDAGRTVQANPAALALTGLARLQEGVPLAEWPGCGPVLVRHLEADGAGGDDHLIALGTPPRWFEIHVVDVAPGAERNRVRLGRMLYLRDVTRREQVAEAMRVALETSQARLSTITDLHAQLARQAVRDPLTQLFNRRHLDAYFGEAAVHARENGTHFALALIDIDHFKAVNDRHGHLVGDDLLKAFADRLRLAGGTRGQAFRIGGEEFLLAMPGAGKPEAVGLLADLRRRNAAPMMTRSGAINVTFSAGLVGLEADGEDLDTLLIRADRRLYAAKRTGRDRVVADDPGAEVAPAVSAGQPSGRVA